MNSIVRPVQSSDNAAVAAIIRAVMPEFGAGGEGFAIHDAEVDNIHAAYSHLRMAYFVCEVDGKVVGTGGVAPLLGGDANTCELKKMYFLKEGRGKGLGRKMVERCLSAAKDLGFEYCYLETLNTMRDAMVLYEKLGFEKIPRPCGSTGHFGCDTFYRKRLR
ncbi:MAG: GNAT family N-acetyltransferase [Bacteroidota bacterium]